MELEKFEKGLQAWLTVGGEPEEGAGCFPCIVDAVGSDATGTTVDITIEGQAPQNLEDNIKKGQGKSRITVAGNTVKGVSDGSVKDTTIKVALRDPKFPTEGYDDMVDLTNLNDAELNQNLRQRFHRDLSYCYCGNTCVALNIFYGGLPLGPGEGKTRDADFEDYPHEGGDPSKPRIDAFSDETQERYMGADKSISKQEGGNEPHVYAIVEDAYQHMFHDHIQGPAKNQAVIITGESGAGKTYITGKCLGYLDKVNGTKLAAMGKQADPITAKIQATMPIMDNFGNACMPRNDDSSRFGKLYQIFYHQGEQIIKGAMITPYLLEKSRVSMQASWERNFHIFYRMVKAFSRDPVLKAKYHILDHCGQYHYLNRFLKNGLEGKDGDLGLEQNGEVCQFTVCNRAAFEGNGGVFIEKRKEGKPPTDDSEWLDFTKAMEQYFDADTRDQIYSIVSGVLLMGNIEFEDNKVKNPDVLKKVGELLKIKAEAGADAGLKKYTESLEEALTRTPLGKGANLMYGSASSTKSQASRDSFAQTLYNDLYIQIVQQCSDQLIGDADPGRDRFLSLLDIFGFEFIEPAKLYTMEGRSFKRSKDFNGINQYFINLCNEKLQNHFVNTVFGNEILAYQQQGLHISKDDFAFEENDSTVDMLMFDGLDMSIINTLDAATKKGLQGGSDDNAEKDKRARNTKNEEFTKKLRSNFSSNKAYKVTMNSNAKPPPERYDGEAFGVHHYAALVTYSVDDWWELNKSTMPVLIHQVATTSEWKNSAIFMMQNFVTMRDPGTGSSEPASIGSQFRRALKSLVDDKLTPCQCQFVRCIKPNKKKWSRATAEVHADAAWQSALVLNQLRYTGMLDTLVIRKQGFPARPLHKEFWNKFALMNTNIRDPKEMYDFLAASQTPKELFNPKTHFFFGTNRVLMKDQTYRHLEAEVGKMRAKYVEVLRAVVQSAHLCASLTVARNAAKKIYPEALTFMQKDNAVRQKEKAQMSTQREAMERYNVENVQCQINEKEERATMLAEEQYMDEYMVKTAAARFQKQKDSALESAGDWIEKCRGYKTDFDNQLALEPQVDEVQVDELPETNQPKFILVQPDKGSMRTRRPGAIRHRIKFTPIQRM